MIKTFGLTKKFGDLIAVSDLNLEIQAGEVFGFLGPNGAGKTTTVRLLNGLLKPSSGSAIVLDKNIEKESSDIRNRCGVQTDTNLYEKLTAFENLEIWGRLFGLKKNQIKKRIDFLLGIFNLSSRRSDLVGNFSKGMKQKLSIARALINEPEILFLDEPTAGLDPEASEELLQFLKTYGKDSGKTVFLCSHRLEEVENLCTNVRIIFKGTMLAQGTIKSLTKKIWPDFNFLIESKELKPAILKDWQKEDFIKKVEVKGNTLQATLTDKEAIAELIKVLVKEKIEIFSVIEEKHSLKDVYLSLVPKEV